MIFAFPLTCVAQYTTHYTAVCGISGTACTSTLNVPATPVAGHVLLIYHVSPFAQSVSSITSTNGDVPIPITSVGPSEATYGTAFNGGLQIVPSSVGGPTTIHVNFSTIPSKAAVYVWEGACAAYCLASLSQPVSNTSASGPIQALSLPNDTAGSIMVAFGVPNCSNTGDCSITGLSATGFTSRGTASIVGGASGASNGTNAIAAADETLSSAGTFQPSIQGSGGIGTSQINIVQTVILRTALPPSGDTALSNLFNLTGVGSFQLPIFETIQLHDTIEVDLYASLAGDIPTTGNGYIPQLNHCNVSWLVSSDQSEGIGHMLHVKFICPDADGTAPTVTTASGAQDYNGIVRIRRGSWYPAYAAFGFTSSSSSVVTSSSLPSLPGSVICDFMLNDSTDGTNASDAGYSWPSPWTPDLISAGGAVQAAGAWSYIAPSATACQITLNRLGGNFHGGPTDGTFLDVLQSSRPAFAYTVQYASGGGEGAAFTNRQFTVPMTTGDLGLFTVAGACTSYTDSCGFNFSTILGCVGGSTDYSCTKAFAVTHSCTETITASGCSQQPTMAMMELSHVRGIDQKTLANSSSGGTLTTSSVTTTAPTEYVIAFCSGAGVDAGATAIPSYGILLGSAGSRGGGEFVNFNPLSTTATFNNSCANGAATSYSAGIITFPFGSLFQNIRFGNGKWFGVGKEF